MLSTKTNDTDQSQLSTLQKSANFVVANRHVSYFGRDNRLAKKNRPMSYSRFYRI